MVGDDTVPCFQHMMEMLYGLIDGQQLAVVSAAFLLSRFGFLGGEKGKGLPNLLGMLLQHGTHGVCGGVCDECEWCGWVRVCQ
jgi:hypothetical protein